MECIGDCQHCHLPYCIKTDNDLKLLYDEIAAMTPDRMMHPSARMKQSK